MNNQLDPQAVNLAKAIRQTESQGNFQAKGKSGEYGAYQYLPETWNSRATKYGVNVPLEQATPEQQNEVTYKWIKEKKDQGYNVGQIASMHNAGEGRPDAYKTGLSGVNASGVKYDVKGYTDKVANEYQKLKSGAGYGYVTPPTPHPIHTVGQNDIATDSTSPVSTAPEKPGILSRIGHGASSLLAGIEKPFVGLAAMPVQALAKVMGKEDPFAQGIPTVASALGGQKETFGVTPLEVKKKLGDAAQVGSYFVPGSGVAGAVGAGVLQGAGNAMSEGGDLAKVATEGALGGVIGGGVAGATKLAGGLIKSAGKMISGKGLQEAQEGIKDAYTSALNLSAAERRFEGKSGKDIAQVLLDNNAPLGRTADGKLDTTAAIDLLQKKLEPLNETARNVLQKPQGVVKNVELSSTLDDVVSRIKKLKISQIEKNDAIKHATDLIKAEAREYGETVTPAIADEIKQGLWGSSFKSNLTTVDKLRGNVSYLTGNALKESIEKAVAGSDTEVGLKALNQQRGDLIDAIKRLSGMNNVTIVKGGRLGNIAGGTIGAIAGLASGTGPLGALAGDYFGTEASKLIQNPAFKIGTAKAKAKAAGMLPKYLGKAASPVGNALTGVGGAVQKTARAAGLLGNIITNGK
jgi:hypothetical protein